jgi:hypothetical protein
MHKIIPREARNVSSHPGVEPGTSGLEVLRAIHCANGTYFMMGEDFKLFQCYALNKRKFPYTTKPEMFNTRNLVSHPRGVETWTYD